MQPPPVRWGILGTGRMADTLAREIAGMPAERAQLVAVGSRSAATAEAFARRHGIPHRWTGHLELARDRDVDAVYVATPHGLHFEHALACLEAGKAVLCEKPFTLNAAQAARLVGVARENGLFLMEAMWTRFLPAIIAVRELVAAGTLGRVALVIGGGAFIPAYDPAHYLFDPKLGGGALLDAGVYLVSLASMILGTPARVLSSGRIGQHGVDEQVVVLLDQPGGAQAALYVSLRARRSPDLEIMGERARVRIDAPVFRPQGLTLSRPGEPDARAEYPIEGTGYGPMIEAAITAIRGGRIESEVMPLEETLSIMRTMDQVRAAIGLRYPGE